MKTIIRKFPEELEQYIKRTNPQGYSQSEPAAAMTPTNHV